MSKSAASLASAFVNKDTKDVARPLVLNSFKGMFGDTKLSEKEERHIQFILNDHFRPGSIDEDQVAKDYEILLQVTSEIKAINNQSLLLHGERIKKAQDILKNYKDGAFSLWLVATYGNRQTPYNMLQYYEFYNAVPQHDRPKIEEMPKTAVYVLATREGSFDRKLEILQKYNGEGKKEIISLIQETFPTSAFDKRKRCFNDVIINNITKLVDELESSDDPISEEIKTRIMDLSSRLISIIGSC